MRRCHSLVLVFVVSVLASLTLAASASAGPPWALIYPTSGTVTGLVGDCRDGCSRFHEGIDIANSRYTDVYATYRGTAFVHPDNGSIAGNWIEVVHANGYTTRYLHLQSFLVSNGQWVGKGQHIAEMGNTGADGIGVHLHYEVRHGAAGSQYPNNTRVDINPGFPPRYGSVTAKAAMPMDFFLAAADIAPFDNELAFVAQQYSDFLRRPISSPEASARIYQLWNGSSGLDVIHEIYRSPEADAAIRSKARLYDAAFNRRPDNGIMTWLGRSPLSVASAFVSSTEGQQKLPTDPTQFVNTVFLYAIGRGPTSDERTLYTTYVRQQGRAAGLLAISDRDDHKLISYGGTGVDLAYIAMLGRVPESTSIRNTWADRLNRYGAFAERDLLNMILHSSEYRGRVARIWGT